MRFIAVIPALLLTTACATQPSEIAPTYISPSMFSAMSCPALRNEATRINAQVASLTGIQQAAADSDGAMMGIGMLIFWPALLGLKGDDNAPQLAQMRGMADAINAAGLQKGC